MSQSGWIVFSDFDGTLTTRDLVEALMREFRPDASPPLVESIKRGEMSLRAGVEALYNLLPSTDRRRYVNFVRHAGKLRPGVDECLDTADRLGMPFYVVSNGLDSFIRPVLGDRVADRYLYTNRAVWRGPRLAVEWPYPCSPVICAADCGLCKPTVMRWLPTPPERTIVIGDGVTDVEAARRADVVLARDQLAARLTSLGKPFHPFEDFSDVAHILESIGRGDVI